VAKPSPLEGAQEIQQMLVAYAKQETVEPLKSLASYLAFGIAGSLLVFMGGLFLGVGVLRMVQSETGDTFSGGSFMSVLPYVIALAALLLVIAFILLLMNRARKRINP
jgi:hypothetical protein